MDKRVEQANNHNHTQNVLYLVQRDFRTIDNYSLHLAYQLSNQSKTCLYTGTDYKRIKQNDLQAAFLVEGLYELETMYKKLNIVYQIINWYKSFIKDYNIDCIVTEFSPLQEVLSFHDELREYCFENSVALYICDSHNIMPCRVVEKYCRTPKALKSKFYKVWDNYFKMHAYLKPHDTNRSKGESYTNNGENANRGYFRLKDYKFGPLNNYSAYKGGYTNGIKQLHNFYMKFKTYKALRNSPAVINLSNLSPWIHSGQLGVYTIIKSLLDRFGPTDDNVICYIDELFGWKQIAEHFCFYEKNYDNINGALPWAFETLNAHRNDPREHIYTLEELEYAKTDDEQWNAGQKELVKNGKMHGYVRMYWAKRLLYWTESPEKAIEYALYLNNKYEIDGNDPNGFLGVMWSICGSMDQGWMEMPVRGKIRGMKSIKAPEYVAKWKKVSIGNKEKQ